MGVDTPIKHSRHDEMQGLMQAREPCRAILPIPEEGLHC